MSETVRLVASGSGKQVYGTRALTAGDQFEMPREWADILILLGKARLADQAAPQPELKIVEPEPGDDLNELRAEARRMGIAWDGRWGVIRLKHEIAQVKQI